MTTNRILLVLFFILAAVATVVVVVQYLDLQRNKERPFRPVCGEQDRFSYRSFFGSGWRPLDGPLAPVFATGWGEPGGEVMRMGVEFPPNAGDDLRSKAIIVVGEDGRLKLPKDAYRGNSPEMVDEILGNFTTKAVVSYIATHPQDVRERLSRWRQAVSEDRRALAGLEDVDDYLNGRRQNADCWVVRVVAIEPEPPLHFD